METQGNQATPSPVAPPEEQPQAAKQAVPEAPQKPSSIPTPPTGTEDQDPENISEMFRIRQAEIEESRNRMMDLLESEYNIPKDHILKWKETYGGIQVAFFDSTPYLFRGMNRMEWKELNRQPTITPDQQLMLEEEVTNRVLLLPREFDLAELSSAGIPSSIFAMVMKLSKFEPDIPPMRL